ncbi:putative G3BP-like protein [Cocos nucifera]|uniref:Putative G3BP-like protein n=1 Tax=Cocos nucifera TaxID=13894 RepID=A0A8K0IF47_COCNU|nr:putative G3BP-like protein [Cocos nucifera]
MASSFPGHVSASQVGTYFVGQYYHVLQQQPDLVHQFYTNASTTMRYDGTTIESATGMLEIHNLVTCLNFKGIEIKTAHSLESWSGGILVMVSGYVQLKDYSFRRKFVQTFFLAPQEKGYFVLNDIFQFIEEDHVHQNPATILTPHNNFETKLDASSPVLEPVSNYMLGEEIHAREFSAPVPAEEDDTVDKYSIPEPQHQVLESDEEIDKTPAEEPTASYPDAMNNMRDPPSALVEEPVDEPPKKTYASILQAKGQLRHSAPQAASLNAASLNKTAQVSSDWQHAPQLATQQLQPAVVPEKSSLEVIEESATFEDEGDARSVYVGNLRSSITAYDLEQEFKNFGRIRPAGVTVRSRKEAGVFYAFIEFEDAVGVQNALKRHLIAGTMRCTGVFERASHFHVIPFPPIFGKAGLLQLQEFEGNWSFDEFWEGIAILRNVAEFLTHGLSWWRLQPKELACIDVAAMQMESGCSVFGFYGWSMINQ